jgi:glutamine synthetase
MAKTVADVMTMVKDNEVKFVDFRFTDTRGKQQHVTVPVSHFDEDKFSSGHAFDGSSIAGWKGIEASDMLLMPDPATANIDPFFEESTLIMNCDVVEPADGKSYDRDPRSIAKRAEAYLKASGIGDTAYFGPEPEFFIFDNVRWSTDPSNTFYEIEEYEAPWNTGAKLEGGNRGHRPTVKGGYFPVPPVDSTQDMRAEMSLVLESLGIPVEVFHHEVAGAGQNEIGTKFSTLVERADWTMLQKYVIQNVANAYGKTATFMPKPYHGDNGSGMHVHQSVWKDGKNLFAGDGYAGLSEFALYYIGGIIKHARALNAITNPGTNSYKRLVPAFRGAGEARLFGQEPLGFDPHPVRGQPEGPPRRGPLPRSPDEPLPGLCGPADGGSGRRGKQDPSGRSRHQGPLPPAAGGRQAGADRLPQPGSGAGASGQGPRLPDQGRRVHRHHARRLHRTQDERSHALPHGGAPG